MSGLAGNAPYSKTKILKRCYSCTTWCFKNMTTESSQICNILDHLDELYNELHVYNLKPGWDIPNMDKMEICMSRGSYRELAKITPVKLKTVSIRIFQTGTHNSEIKATLEKIKNFLLDKNCKFQIRVGHLNKHNYQREISVYTEI